MPKAIFIFLDGVGMGDRSGQNPFYVCRPAYLPFYSRNPGWPDKTPVKPIDPLLGVGGFPQSASGQTSLYTGISVPGILKRHKGSYPDKTMRKIIKERNILSRLKHNGTRAAFINAYPVYTRFFTPKHIHILDDGQMRFSGEFPEIFKRRISVTTCMMISARQLPFNETDIIEEKTVYQDYSNRSLRERGLIVPEFSPEKAAEIIFKKSLEYDFILYEYFQTDICGHRKTLAECIELIEKLNRLFKALVSLLDRKTDTLMVTSDHGNLEDCSARTHTRNPVPLITWGNAAEKLRRNINDIAGVTPEIINFFFKIKKNPKSDRREFNP
jgi:2,3-bisphosphoglycerate-independent phosphoglycerate mutase